MSFGGRLLGNYTLNTSGTTITTSYVQLSAVGNGLNGTCVYAYNGGSQPLMLGSGPSGSESNICLIVPGNGAFLQGVQVPAGRLAIKSLGAPESSGIVSIDIYG